MAANDRTPIPNQYQPGLKVRGRVIGLRSFGAFLEVGSGVAALLLIPEISEVPIRHPGDVLKEGQEIEVMILHVNREQQKVSVSLKRAKAPDASTGQ